MTNRAVRLLLVAVAQGLLLMLLAAVLPGLRVGSPATAVAGAVVIAAVTGAVWPFFYAVAHRLPPLLFPVLTFLLTGTVVLAVGVGLSRVGGAGLRVDSLGTGIVVALALAAATTLLGVVLAAVDDAAYDRFVTESIRRAHAGTPRSATPGWLFLEIDGLAEPVLRTALAAGRLPTLRRWLETGSHALRRWEPDLSSQTAASQAGILLGSNHDVPAFRWYERALGQVLVASRLATAAAVERRLSRGDGLLANGGASRCNMFSGDAADSLFTFSRIEPWERSVGGERGGHGSYFFFFFSNPYNLTRTVVLYATEVVREVVQAWRQRIQRVQPRVRRGGIYPFVRAFATAVGPELATYAVIMDIYRGVPAVYATYYAYDEVAHHSGILSPDAMSVLAQLDRSLARIERAARHAPRPYHLVVLSDHGQSNGATFKQRFGEPLAALVDRLTPRGQRIVTPHHASETWGHINASINEVVARATTPAGLVRRATARSTRDGLICLGPDDQQPVLGRPEQADARVVVLASGNLGLIYFAAWPRRMTSEEIAAAFPDLLPGLVRHEGIGFVLVHSEREGAVVLGSGGAHYLDQGRIEGEDPLAPFGPAAAAHLLRHDRFSNAPDVLVNSLYRPETGEVAAFEELVGSHGGLGGPQTEPFVVYPTGFDPGPRPIVGAAALHRVFAGWLAAVRGPRTDEATATDDAAPG